MKHSILDILSNELIGKSIRVQTFSKPIQEKYYVRVKKSNSVTDAQFNSGNPKFSYLQQRVRVIGYHAKYDTFTITDFHMEQGHEYREIYSYITLSNDKTYSFDDYFETPLEDIILK